jgi:hypothetical protein
MSRWVVSPISMSFIIKLIASASAAKQLSQAADEATAQSGLNVVVGGPHDSTPEGYCEVHFWHEDLDIESREMRDLTGRFITTPELVESLARAVGQILAGTVEPVLLEATWQPSELTKTEQVTSSQLLDLIRRNGLKMDRRYEIAEIGGPG